MTMKTLTCPKCGADRSNKYLAPGFIIICRSCKVFLCVDDGVLVRLTAEEIAAIPEDEMVLWKSINEVPSGRIKNDYENSNQR
jgi:hypothetical protein